MSSSANRKILFVDDDPHVLSSYQRSFRGLFQITCAEGPQAALEILRSAGSPGFAVIVSDFKMPLMNGLDFLKAAKKISPNSVTVMLTGFAEIDTAMKAINEGAIFRFLTKPCPFETLSSALEACVEQYRLLLSEKELLRGTLQGAIKLTTSLLAMASPEAFGTSDRIRRLVASMLKNLSFPNGWQIEIAAMLSQIGCVALPPELLAKVSRNDSLTAEEKKQYESFADIGAKLLANIPRLEEIAEIVKYQNLPSGELIPAGARVIHLAKEYDRLLRNGISPTLALDELTTHKSQYGDQLLAALKGLILTEQIQTDQSTLLSLMEIREGMIVDENVFTKDNLLLLARGQELTEASIARLRNYGIHCGVQPRIKVLIVPETTDVNKE